jgi:hypothetical protein
MSQTLAISAQTYLYVVAGVSAFRVAMYVLFIENVTSVKINPKIWNDAAVQEVAYGYSGVIRLLCMLRAALCYWGARNLPPSLQGQLALITFMTDLQIYYTAFKMYSRPEEQDEKKAFTRTTTVAMGIQTGLVCTGILWLLHHTF